MVRSSTILAHGGVITVALTLSMSPVPQGLVNPPGDPAEVGQWLPPETWEVIAIHSAVLPTGKVLQYAYPAGGSKLWDPETGQFEDANVDSDLFCSGLSFQSDGTLFVTGGNDYDCDFQGRFDTHIYDPFDEEWVRLDDMADGRWYPTNVELGDGRTLIFSGLDRDCDNNPDIELYTPGVGLEVVGARTLPLFPKMHLLTNGRVALVGPSPSSWTYDVDTNTWKFVDNTTWTGWRRSAPSVLIPGRTDEIMILGGGVDGNITNTCEIIDFKETDPQWRYTAPLNHARKHFDTLILPDKTIFICGGGLENLYFDPVLIPELFDPATESWIDLPPHQNQRMYHATTVLLQDGRVLVAGQDHGNSAFSGEIYLPRYLFRGDRPEISDAPRSVGYGGAFALESDQADEITSVCLIAPSANTHSINMTQRYVELPFQLVNSNTLLVDAPTNGNEAPPGYYMLFIRNGDEVPSVAAMVRVGDTTSAKLTDIAMQRGRLLDGTLDDLSDSDDSHIHTQAGFGYDLSERPRAEMVVSSVSYVEDPVTLDITIESRINEQAGTAQIRLRNWNTGEFDQVGQFPLGPTEATVTITEIDATIYVDAEGNIDLSIKHMVEVPLFALFFESFFDLVEISVK